ncbi:hypothetical protein CVT24_010076 [Panaeolus cyanescens]|uniref:Uncharacterized protein n=1 Tax=Panaeolus cyanescens TaxID=181874 RepID=A0A409W923_9AGAR|nr:hypothetical protein CVT24_010076 [Panaeolus cyanescens]
MVGPTPGRYIIKSFNEEWAICAHRPKASSQPGDMILAFKDADQKYPEHSIFIADVSVSGQYAFRNPKTKMYIGSGVDGKGNPTTAWTVTPQYWDVDPAGPGLWTISMPGAANAFWYNAFIEGNTWAQILLAENQNIMQYYWIFVGASSQ